MVMLIIAILVAVALPQYEMVIDQTRWSTLLPAVRSLKDAQERMWMTASTYSNDVTTLDINIPGEYDGEQITSGNITYILNNSGMDHSITATHDKVPGVVLEQFLTVSRNFSNDLHCKAITGNSRAMRFCGQLALDNVLGTSGDYTVFLLEGDGMGNLSPW